MFLVVKRDTGNVCEKVGAKNMLVLSLIVAVLPAIIMTVFVNFGIGILAYVLCMAGSFFGFKIGKKIRDYAGVSAVFGKSTSDIAWKKFTAQYGTQISGFALGIILPILLLNAIFNNPNDTSRGKLKNHEAGKMTKTTKKAISGLYEKAEAHIQKYGKFKLQGEYQSEEVDGGICVVLRYEPTSDRYAKYLSNEFFTDVLRRPLMKPVEDGIRFDEYIIHNFYDEDKDVSKDAQKLWNQDAYTVHVKLDEVQGNVKSDDIDYQRVNRGATELFGPKFVLADTIKKLNIDSVLYMDTNSFSYENYYEEYKNYNIFEYSRNVVDFIFTGKRYRDSCGDNLEDWLDWNRYFVSIDFNPDPVDIYTRKDVLQGIRKGADYEHWYFDHNKTGSEDDYYDRAEKYMDVGIPTKWAMAKERANQFRGNSSAIVLTPANYYDFDNLRNYKPSQSVSGWFRNTMPARAHGISNSDFDNCFLDYCNSFIEFAESNWQDYPDGMKVQKAFKEWKEENPNNDTYNNLSEYGLSKGMFSEMENVFAKEYDLQSKYDAIYKEIADGLTNVNIEERKQLFSKLVDLKDCKVYIDYMCVAASDSALLSAIADTRGVLAYKVQIQPGKWVPVETYFTLRPSGGEAFLWY